MADLSEIAQSLVARDIARTEELTRAGMPKLAYLCLKSCRSWVLNI